MTSSILPSILPSLPPSVVSIATSCQLKWVSSTRPSPLEEGFRHETLMWEQAARRRERRQRGEEAVMDSWLSDGVGTLKQSLGS